MIAAAIGNPQSSSAISSAALRPPSTGIEAKEASSPRVASACSARLSGLVWERGHPDTCPVPLEPLGDLGLLEVTFDREVDERSLRGLSARVLWSLPPARWQGRLLRSARTGRGRSRGSPGRSGTSRASASRRGPHTRSICRSGMLALSRGNVLPTQIQDLLADRGTADRAHDQRPVAVAEPGADAGAGPEMQMGSKGST